jgi:hypothetical protein
MSEKDPRTKPLDQCWSLGHLMATIEECKSLDKLEKVITGKDPEKRRNEI